ncbi:hypothetical protein Cni_G10936 [Canna indica]|uniref:Homeobox domain-containing protein n=1 Tax=Canna indica TaxID=4628 RepID=A0AAQ3K5G2_9LILI|nr:hypothetical protein Cni_G10936 [Canna indica]
MEHGGTEGDGDKRDLEAGLVPSEVKKQWKNPSQVQILENAYAVSPNPPAAMKEELAKLTGLDYKQVQYWFGNRRYMDRHGPRRYKFRNDDYLSLKYANMTVIPSFSASPISISDSMVGTESYPYRNFEMHQTFLAAGPVVMQAEIATQMPEELQGVVMHIEKKLRHPLKIGGPILGVEFKPLPPGAFGALLAQPRAPLWPCDGKVNERQIDKPNKAVKLVPMSECCLVTNLANEPTLRPQNVDALNMDSPTKAVQEYQFFPMQPSWSDNSERAKEAHFPLSSANTSIYVELSTSSGGQNFTEFSCAPSAFPSQGQQNASNQPQQDKHIIISSKLNGDKKTSTILYTNSALDSQSGNHGTCEVDNYSLSFDKPITQKIDICRREKLQLPGSTSANGSQQHDYTEMPIMIDAKKERDLVSPDLEHGNSGQGGREQGGLDTSDFQGELRTKHSSTLGIFKGIDDKNCHNVTINQTSSSQLHSVGHWRGYSRFLVRPRESSQSSTMIADDTRLSYFSNTGGCPRTLIAEWNEIEKKAFIIENDNENAPSWSSGSDSTCSDGFVNQAIENGKHEAQTKSVYQFSIDNKVDIHKDHNRQDFINADQNIEADEDETDDENYNGMEGESRVKHMIHNEDRGASPLSSEQTA